MTEDIAAKIREALADHEACVDNDCHAEHIQALRDVLEICRMLGDVPMTVAAAPMLHLTAGDIVSTIAGCLGISVSPLRGPTGQPVGGVRPGSGDPTEDAAWLEAEVRDDRTRDAQTGYEGR